MSQAFPAYSRYGEPAGPVDLDFVHVDRVMLGRNAHGGIIAPHLHPHFGQLSLWFKGRGRYEIEGRTFDFTAPMMHFVPANTLHGFRADPATSDCWTISIANHALASMATSLSMDLTRSHFVLAHEGEAQNWKAAKELFELAASEYVGAGLSRTRLVELFAQALFEIFSRMLAEGDSFSVPRSIRLAHDFQALVDMNFAKDLRITDYCHQLGVTRYLLGQACQEVWKMGIKDLINQTRLRVAQRMLHYTIHSVEVIAYETGFNDPAYFSRFFRKMTGQSPALWRKRLGAGGSMSEKSAE